MRSAAADSQQLKQTTARLRGGFGRDYPPRDSLSGSAAAAIGGWRRRVIN